MGINTEVKLKDIVLKNPILTASGTFGYGEEFKEFIDLNRLGGFVIKGTTLEERQGNPYPRIYETSAGMLNAIGFQNVGFDKLKLEKYPFLKELNTNVFVNITGNSIDEFAMLTEKLNELDIAGIEINISCPNIKAGGINMGTDPEMAYNVVKAVKEKSIHHVMVKLTPNVTDIKPIAKAVEDAGADSISLINTLVGMAVDIDTRKPKISNIIAGLSGPAIKPVAVRLVWEVAKTVKIPVIGMGGISNYRDVLEFLIVGATAVQIGTANFYNPRVTMDILDDLEKYLLENGIYDINDIIGTFEA